MPSKRSSVMAALCVGAVCGLLAALAPGEASAQRRRNLSITSVPAGATVYLDAEGTAPLGITPIRRVRVTDGQHNFIFVLAGHETATVPVVVGSRTRSVIGTLQAVATIDLSAGNDAARGARVRLDGVEVGTIPYRATVSPGRHLVQVGRAGHVTFSQWVEVAGGQVATLPVALEQERPRTGSILVSADVSGAEIFVDGTAAGVTPTVVENLTPGPHRVEVRHASGNWSDTITVIEGQRVTASARVLPQAPPGGTVRVLASVDGARVYLDGEDIGTSPATRENVPAGQHIVEARAPGHDNVEQTITVTAGQQSVVRLTLPASARIGRIRVTSPVPGATVFIDGAERGPVPVDIADAAEGTYSIVVRARGFRDFEEACTLQAGGQCEIVARMQALALVEITSNAPGARLFVDDVEVGGLPYSGGLEVGTRRFRVEARDYHPADRSVRLEASTEPQPIVIELERSSLTEEELARLRAASVMHAAHTLQQGQSAFDLSIGYPYQLELRGTVGILGFLAAGVDLRVLERGGFENVLFELGLRANAGYRFARFLSAGGEIEAHASTSFGALSGVGMSALGAVSLHLGERAALTLRGGLDFFSDSWEGQEGISKPREGPGAEFVDGEQAAARFRLGLALDVVLSPGLNFFLLFDGIAAGDERLLLRDSLFDIVSSSVSADPRLYFRLGVTLKF